MPRPTSNPSHLWSALTTIVDRLMFARIILLAVLASATAWNAAGGPIRVLFLGTGEAASRLRCHVLMEQLGRDAIWFDHTAGPAVATADWMTRFDAVLVDAPADQFPALARIHPARVITPSFPADQRAIASIEFLHALRDAILAAAGDQRRSEWRAFLDGREPERREPDPNVANYERRAEPVTFQHPFSVEGSIQRTQVPPDMRLELFAAEPDIAKPIAFAWDERGRCWVAETRDYPHDVAPQGVGRDAIKICEDTDGDGRADRFIVFADGLNIPTSLTFANGGVLVTQPPRLLFLKDTDGDDRADVREVVMEGWGIHDTHAQANNLHYGHDNWIYGCVGYSGFDGTVGGRRLNFAMGTFRFKPDGSALEFLHQFTNNSWGHSANRAGDQFGGTANGAPIFYGGIPASVVPEGMRVMTARKINIEDRCHAITPNYRQVDVFGGYTAAAGTAFIDSANLPQRLQGMAMVCEPTMKVIALMDVQPDGAGYVAGDGFNLVASTDEWMSPVFAEVGPDGAVWFADWQNFIIQHNPTPTVERGGYNATTGVGGAHENPLRDHSRGRIYRVVWDKARQPVIRSLDGASDDALVSALGSDNAFWRLTAQRLIVENNRRNTAEALRATVHANDGSIAAIHALWSLRGLGLLDDATHQAALIARDPILRRNATRALSDGERGRRLFFSAGVISDPELTTRLAALVKLAEFDTSDTIRTVVTNLARDEQNRTDPWLAESVRVLIRAHDVITTVEGPNLLPNPGFELVDHGLPAGWTRRDYNNLPANRTAEWQVVSGPGMVHSGERAVRCVSPEGHADTSLHADVELQPNTQYRLSGWVRSDGISGKLSLNDHLNRYETEHVTARESDWTNVEVVFNSGDATRGSINVLHVGRGTGYFDDVKLAELLPAEDTKPLLAADPARGEHVFYKHVAACVLCHSLEGSGSTVGPPLDGIALKGEDYLIESLINPNAAMAEGYEQLGISPMPPMNAVLTEQEMADVVAFMKTLKTPLPEGTVIQPAANIYE